jgi:hypothetical protein
MVRIRSSGSLILAAALVLASEAAAQTKNSPSPAGEPVAALAEYNARRDCIPDTAEAHLELALWCEQKGLKSEAVAEFAAVLGRNPKCETAWKHLGFKKHEGRWVTKEQITAEDREAKLQRKADREWEPRLRKWKSSLATKAKRGEAEDELAAVTDPRAVPSIWKVFAAGHAPDQRQAVQLLGQIASASASRALALLAVSGETSEVRRTATETLRSRNPLEFADVLISLLRDPIKYEVRAVIGPGLPGSLTIKGPSFNLERVYAPPPLPDLSILPGDNVRFGSRGGPILIRHTDATMLPFAWVSDSGYEYRTRYAIAPHVPVVIQLGAMWRENWKSAQSAQQQLRSDVDKVEWVRHIQRAANEQVVRILNDATGQKLPADRTACWTWWFGRLDRVYAPRPEAPRPTLTEMVALDYLPGTVGGLGFDPIVGYYLRASTFGRGR